MAHVFEMNTHCNDHCLFTVHQSARNCSRFLNAQKTPFSAHKVHFAKLDAACCASCKKLDAACCASCKKLDAACCASCKKNVMQHVALVVKN